MSRVGTEVERRWLVIVENGQHSTLGREMEPDDAQIGLAGEQLDRLDLGGWLVMSEGRYYAREAVALLPIRVITQKLADWPEAEKLWHQARRQATT